MDHYTVDLSPLPDHTIPASLLHFGDWLATQGYGTVGWFSLQTESIPREWNPESADRLQRDGFAFLRTPDGSLLVLFQRGSHVPPAVVLLGSEGETDTVATSLEEFLVLLSRAETGLADLDEEGSEGRTELRSWLTENRVTAPIASPFDFDAYLDNGAAVLPPQTIVPSEEAAALQAMTPLLRTVVRIVGRRADDPEVGNFVTDVLGKKVSNSTTDASPTKYVTATKEGIELAFAHNIRNEKYPLLSKSKHSYVPYVQIAWLTEKFADPLPFGLRIGMTAEEISSRLGVKPIEVGTARRPEWRYTLDAARDICLAIDKKRIAIQVEEAQEVSSPHGVPSRSAVALFVAWAIQRGLLNVSRLPEYTKLLESIRKRERRGSELVERGLPRGLWDIHMKDEPGLRAFTIGWFHNIGGAFIRDDLIQVFGGRKGPYGHPEVALDDDDWANVDKAAAILDSRFTAWIKSSS